MADSLHEKKTYEKVHDVLHRIQRAHRRLRQELEATNADDIQTTYLIESFKRGEAHFEAALAEYRTEYADLVAETWLQYVPDEQTQQLLESIHFPEGVSSDQALDIMLEFENALIACYERLASQTAIPKVRDLFSSLKTQAEREAANAAWRARDEGVAPKGDSSH